MHKSIQQIRTEIAGLEDVKTRLPDVNSDQEPIHGAVEQQIVALRQIEVLFLLHEKHGTDFERCHVDDALKWAFGESKKAPSQDWEVIAKPDV